MSSPQELKRKAKELRQSLVSLVLGNLADLPNAPELREFLAAHSSLQQEIEAARQRVSDVSKSKAEYEPLEQKLRVRQQDLTKAESALASLHRGFGKAAFEAHLAGHVKDQPAFANRLAIHIRLQQLRKEHESLAPPLQAGLLEKGKATAKQLMVAGKIKLEELKIGGAGATQITAQVHHEFGERQSRQPGLPRLISWSGCWAVVSLVPRFAWAVVHQGPFMTNYDKSDFARKTTAAVNNEGVVGTPYPTTPYKVPKVGLEPTRDCSHWILRPICRSFHCHSTISPLPRIAFVNSWPIMVYSTIWQKTHSLCHANVMGGICIRIAYGDGDVSWRAFGKTGEAASGLSVSSTPENT